MNEPLSPPAAQGTVAGWKLVPVEPTPEMICAGVQMVSIGHGAVSGVPAWKAMLAAAPEPPASPSPEALPASRVEVVAEALWQAASERAAGRRRLTAWGDESEETRDQWRFMAQAAITAAPDPGQVDVTDQMVEAACIAHYTVHPSPDHYITVCRRDNMRAAIIAALSSTPAPEDRADG